MSETLKQRTDKAREIAHALFKEAGYREYKVSPLDHGDRLWARSLDASGMQIHFEEFSWDNSSFPPHVRDNIPAGGELSFTVGTWSNTPHMRFEVHHVRVSTMMDIRAAEAKIQQFIEAFEITRERNMQGDGVDQSLGFISVGQPDMGTRLALLRMPILRERCIDYCPDVLRALEEKRKTWEESYEVHFSLRISCASPPGISISYRDSDPEPMGKRLNLLHLVANDDLIRGELIDDDMCAPFMVDKDMYESLRGEIEEELSLLERRVRDA